MSTETIKVTYDSDALALIRKLTDIRKEFTIEKSEDKKSITITARTPSRSVAYDFKAPIDMFNFEGDNITYFDFKEFYTLFSVNDDPILKQGVNKFEIIKDRAKLVYYLGEKEATEDSDDEYEEYVAFDESHASFTMTAETMKKLKNMISLTKAEDLIFKVKDDKILIKLYYGENQPTYEEIFDLDGPAVEDFQFIVDTEIIKLSPENDYVVDLNSAGVVRLKYMNDKNIELNLYISEIEEEIEEE
jgi:hypothetical protein